jgi:large subunit ribosomal protein L16
MLSPKKFKYRKQQRGRIHGIAWKGSDVSFGDMGIFSLEKGKLSNRVLEAARVAINRKLKRGGKVWIRVFPDYPFTKKPAEVRMGKGKGNPEAWVAKVKPGTMLFEVRHSDPELAEKALKSAMAKFPLLTKIAKRRDF